MKTALYYAGYRTGKYDFMTLRPLRVFRGANDGQVQWIAGYKEGYADGCRSGRHVDPDRIRSGPVAQLTAASMALSIFTT